MKKKNILVGDICKLDVVLTENKKENLDSNGNLLNVEVTGTIEFIDVPVRKKVVLVKLPNNKYVEATKLKSYKDLINAYKDVLFNTDLYTISNTPKSIEVTMKVKDGITTGNVEADTFISEQSLTRYYNNNGNITLKKLTKELNS